MNDKSILDIIDDSRKILTGNWGKIIGIIFLFLFSIFLLCFFPFIGFSVAIFAYCFLCLGLSDFFISVVKKEDKSIESLFSKYNQCLSAFCLKTIKMVYVILWSLLLIVPGIICLLNYSFATCIMAENQDIDAFSALKQSKNLAYGYRTNILFIYIYFVIMVLLTYSISLLLPLLITLFIPLPLWSIFVISLGITLIITILFYLPFFHISITNFYLEIKNYQSFYGNDILKTKIRNTKRPKKSKNVEFSKNERKKS